MESAFLLGAPVLAGSGMLAEDSELGRWQAARGVVAHRLVNCYASSDWLISLAHRTTTVTMGTLAAHSPVLLHPCRTCIVFGSSLSCTEERSCSAAI